MQLKNFIVIFCALQASEGFFFGIEKSFDFSKFQGPVPTDPDVWRNVVGHSSNTLYILSA